MFKTLISTSELSNHLNDPDWAIMDCRFSLDEPERGRRNYLQGHIPGAVYANLNQDLSGQVIPGVTGRHPLPPVEALIRTFSGWGIGPGVQVVAYDDWKNGSGAIAARLWWMLQWLGHDASAVLDGGWERWVKEDRPVRSGEEQRSPLQFVPHMRPDWLASDDEVDAMRLDETWRVLDARSADRFHGENENRDPVAGHIPGAHSAPYAGNMGPDGLFLPAEELAARYRDILGGVSAERAAVYCGSGVTAAHDVLAIAHAGLGQARLFVGSWSEWITDPQHPVEK